MALLESDLAEIFSVAFSGIYLDATLHRATLTQDGTGGGSATYTDEPVKAQLDATTAAMQRADNYADTDQRILVLAYNVDPIDTDCEITVKGKRWAIASVGQDPAAAAYELRGRLSGYVAPPITSAVFSGSGLGGLSLAGGPDLVADIDVANESYTLNGAPVTFADLLTEYASNPIPKIDNVGLRVEKLAGSAAQPIEYALLSPALYALLNQLGGFTAVVDFTFDNQVDSLPAHPSLLFAVFYGDDALAHINDDMAFGWHTNVHGATTPHYLVTYNEDYDLAVTNYTEIESITGIAASGEAYASLGGILRSYFGDNLATVAESDVGIPYPHSGAEYIMLYLRAAVHQGTAPQQLDVAGRVTIPRIRFYTPAQPAGWVP